MAIVITDFVKETLARHCLGFISSFNGSNKNEMTRAFGYSFNEPAGIMTIMVLKEDSARLLACLAQTKKLAFVASDPMTHHTLQIKGDYMSHADASPEEVNLIKNEFDQKWRAVFKMFHCPDNFVENLKMLPALSLKMECKEIYNQTPRINPGNKIS
jgi:hypothetical protein